MQSLAKQGDVEEGEVVDFILDGIQHQVANIQLLMTARTLGELKALVNRYQERYLKLGANQRRQTAAPARTSTPSNSQENATAVKDLPLCFNCSQRGHMKPNCPHPLRPNGSCFRCWKMGHDHRSCTNPRKVLRPHAAQPVAAVQAEDTIELEALNLVSIAFEIDPVRSAEFRKFSSLFDTGSPISFIRRSCVPERAAKTDAPTSDYFGIGGRRLNILGNVKCLIKFKRQSRKIKIHILPDEEMLMPLILGRNFLNSFRIRLTKLNYKYEKNELLTINKSETSSTPLPFDLARILDRHSLYKNSNEVEKINAEELSVGTSGSIAPDIPDIFKIEVASCDSEVDVDFMLDPTCRQDLVNLVLESYVNSKARIEPCDYKMKIHLTTTVPFHCSPRRLSFAERTDVQNILNDLESQGIIRPSVSPYASAIVLVKKRTDRRDSV